MFRLCLLEKVPRWSRGKVFETEDVLGQRLVHGELDLRWREGQRARRWGAHWVGGGQGLWKARLVGQYELSRSRDLLIKGERGCDDLGVEERNQAPDQISWEESEGVGKFARCKAVSRRHHTKGRGHMEQFVDDTGALNLGMLSCMRWKLW